MHSWSSQEQKFFILQPQANLSTFLMFSKISVQTFQLQPSKSSGEKLSYASQIIKESKFKWEQMS